TRQALRRVVPAALIFDQPEKVEGVRMLGSQRERRAIPRLGGIEVALLMLAERGGQRALQRFGHRVHGEGSSLAPRLGRAVAPDERGMAISSHALPRICSNRKS